MIAIALLVLCGLAIAFAASCLFRGASFRPVRSRLALRVAQRTEHPNEWVTLVLRRPTLQAWRPLPAFGAGQSIAVTRPEGRVRRRYSLARWRRWPFHYEITVKPEPQGRVSNWLASAVTVGDVLQLERPSGDFVLPIRPLARRCVLIAGGVGITPLLAMLDQAIRAGSEFETVHLYWQVRTGADLMYRRALDAIARQHANVSVRYLLSRPSEGVAERIDVALLKRELGGLDDCHFLLCAGQSLLDDLVSALKADGVPEYVIAFERFGIGTSAGSTGKWRLKIDDLDLRFEEHPSLLDALEEGGVALASDCRSGTCGRCCVKILSGEVRTIIDPALELPSRQVLSCCSVPKSDLVLAIPVRGDRAHQPAVAIGVFRETSRR